MTRSQKILITKLLTGHFLVRSRDRYTLYDEKVNPIIRIREKTFRAIDQFIDPKIKIWKTDKRDRITLNLSMVRRLHGKSTLKKLYKQRTQLDTSGTIYKPKQRTAKKIINEKACTLF